MEEFQKQQEDVKRGLNELGLPVHKEDAGLGMRKGLGLTITEFPRTLKVSEEKMRDLVLATEALALEDWVRPATVSTLMGLWTWAMLVVRPALSIPDKAFAWLSSSESLKKPRKMWKSVKEELMALAAMSIYMRVDLTIPWWPKAYITDASGEGYGAIVTGSSVEEVRPEAQRSATQGWTVTAEDAHRRTEEECTREGEEGDMEEDIPFFERLGRAGFLELLSGSANLSGEIKGKIPTWVESWDVMNGPELDLLRPEVMARLMLRVKRKEFWFVHMGPPCATFSRARWPRLRSRLHMWGLPTLKPREILLARDGSLLCLVAVEVALLCCRLDVGFMIENPLTSLMWSFPPTLELLRKEKIYIVVLDYCQYGETWRKSIQLVTHRPVLLVLGGRCRGSFQRCPATERAHKVLRGLAPSGELWTKVACPYPEEMCRAYAEAIEDQAPEVSGRPVPGARTSCPWREEGGEGAGHDRAGQELAGHQAVEDALQGRLAAGGETTS